MPEEREMPRPQEPDAGKNSGDNASAEDLFSQMQDAFQSLQQKEEQPAPATDDFSAEGGPVPVTPPQPSAGSAPTKNHTGTLLIALMAVSGTLVVAALFYMFFLLGSDSVSPDNTLPVADLAVGHADGNSASSSAVTPQAVAPAVLSADRTIVAPVTQDIVASDTETPTIPELQITPAADRAIAVPETAAITGPPAMQAETGDADQRQNRSLQDAVADSGMHTAISLASPSETTADDATIDIPMPQSEAAVAYPQPRPFSAVTINGDLDPLEAVEANIVTVAITKNRWVIYLASFVDSENAGKMLAHLKNDGVACRSIEVSIANQPWYRIYVPGFARVQQAREQMQLLSEKYGFESAWIGKAPAAAVE